LWPSIGARPQLHEATAVACQRWGKIIEAHVFNKKKDMVSRRFASRDVGKRPASLVGYSAACRGDARMDSSPSAALAEIVVRTM
jgi:hypothetical protein